MRVETLGEGEPEVAVVGAIHGDEPCGATAVEAVLETDPDVEWGLSCPARHVRPGGR